MKNVLTQIGNIPVTAAALASLYPHIVGSSQKLQSLEKRGDIIRLKRGIYVASPDVTGKPLSEHLIANHLYAPSYVSMSTALRYYGLIPEAVYTVQSMTLKHPRSFDTPLGRFTYKQISRASYPIGVTSIVCDGYAFLMASPEKALCDLIAASPGINLTSLADAERYICEDIRIDSDDLLEMNTGILGEYAAVGKKANSIRTLIKYQQSL